MLGFTRFSYETSAEKLTKLGDYRENPVVQKNERNEAFMAAWKETLLVIEWAEKRESGNRVEKGAKIKSKKSRAEQRLAKDAEIKSKNTETSVQIIHVTDSRVLNICIKPQPGKNKIVVIGSS